MSIRQSPRDARPVAPSQPLLSSATIIPTRSRSSLLFGVALAGIMLLGLSTRLYGLTNYGIWFDEAYHVQLVRLPTVWAMLEAVLSNPPSDPLYVLLLRPWVALFGSSDASVRALSVVFSTATLPATYWLGRAVAGRVAGLIGALFLAVSPYAVELGQEAALYALASLACTLALAAGWRWRASGRGALLFVIPGILAIYSHYVVAAILALFALLALHPAAGPRQVTARAWLVAHGAILAAWLPWLVALALYWRASAVPRATLPQYATAEEMAEKVFNALIQFTSGTASFLQGERTLQLVGLLVGGGLLALGWLAGHAPARRGLRLTVVLSGLIFFVPALASLATGLWLFVPHFMLFLLPALFVVLGAGLRPVVGGRWSANDSPKSKVQSPGAIRGDFGPFPFDKLRVKGMLWTLDFGQPPILFRILFIILLALWLGTQVWGLALFHRHPPHGADGLRELAAVLRDGVRPGDAVLVTPPALTPTLRQYYPGEVHALPSDFDLRKVYLPYEPSRWYLDSVAALDRETAGRTRVWLVYRPELDEGGRFLGTMQGRYNMIERRTYQYASLYLFDVP